VGERAALQAVWPGRRREQRNPKSDRRRRRRRSACAARPRRLGRRWRASGCTPRRGTASPRGAGARSARRGPPCSPSSAFSCPASPGFRRPSSSARPFHPHSWLGLRCCPPRLEACSFSPAIGCLDTPSFWVVQAVVCPPTHQWLTFRSFSFFFVLTFFASPGVGEAGGQVGECGRWKEKRESCMCVRAARREVRVC
jgi:hypothetical protein